MDIDNSMERACDKWENSQEYRNYRETVTNNLKESAEILGTDIEKRKLEVFNT